MGKLFSEALLEELERHFKQDKKLVGTLQGVIQFNFLLNSRHGGTWHMVLRGQNAPSTLVIGKPKGYKPDVIMTIEDKDFLKMASGGLSGKKAYSQKKLKIQGDFLLAQDFEHRFLQAGGPGKALQFLRNNALIKSKL